MKNSSLRPLTLINHNKCTSNSFFINESSRDLCSLWPNVSSFQGYFQLGRYVYLISDGSIVASSITHYVIITTRKPLLFTFCEA